MEKVTPKHLKEKVLSNVMIGPGIYKMRVRSQYLAHNARPGQFVNIKCSEGLDTVLRRPVSICNVNRQDETADIVFQVRGTGTRLLSARQAGDDVDMLGPLGSSFHAAGTNDKIAVVGGGIGIFPLLFLLNESKVQQKYAFLGFRSSEHIVLKKEFDDSVERLFISTEDGSAGNKGFITDPLEKELERVEIDIIYTCGPLLMEKKVADIAKRHNVKCQVSLEERMGCGIGACLVCACKTKFGDEWEYSHVCKDGPVFWSENVVFE